MANAEVAGSSITPKSRMTTLLAALALFGAASASAAPVSYEIDPSHTFPSFEADHMGISFWRGKINRSSGQVVLDRAAGTGTVEIEMDVASIDFGQDQLNTWAAGKDLFDVPTHGAKAIYKGTLAAFSGGAPTEVRGNLTLHGVTKPVVLKVNRFKCLPHPMLKRELCGADASTTIDRAAFGLTAGKDYGFSMDVALRIQVEAIATK
jgi:polyisoprenoid-binding protein YceI